MNKSKKMIFKWVSIVLAIVFTLCPLSLAFADDEPTPTPIPQEIGMDMWHDSALAIIWAMLKAWDIEITYNDLDYYTEEVGEQITDLVIQYLDSLPSVGSIIAWTQLWTWGSDFWGNVRMNSSMLEDIEDFANWLITTFNLTNNSTTVINGQYSVSGYPLYNLGQYYEIVDRMGGSHQTYVAVDIDTNSATANFPIGYFVFQFDNDITNYYWCFILDTYNLNNQKVTYSAQGLKYDGTTSNLVGGQSNSITNNGTIKYAGYWQYRPLGFHPRGEVAIISNLDNFMSGKVVTLDGSNKIITSVINLPTNDSSYTAGDGMTIIDNQPVYGQVEVVNPIQVGNLPAIVSTGRISNLDVSSVTLPFSGFINMMSDGLELMTDIIYNFPTAIITFALAIISATIVFGVIKVLKEH